jgi:hypothetical protein
MLKMGRERVGSTIGLGGKLADVPGPRGREMCGSSRGASDSAVR